MSRRAASFVLGFALALLVGGGLWWWLAGRPQAGRGRGAAGAAAQPAQKVTFQLFFPADGGTLKPEPRELQVSDSPRDRMRKILDALLVGPKAAGLARPLPEGVMVGGVLLGKDGTAYVDLRWPGHEEPPPGGSTEEIQRVYSVVDSLTLNVPEAQRVVLLWNGVQRDTFSGHLDLSRPLVPDRTRAGS
ncbi:MAG TPA: GerMN domain-containing protein [Thermoanaerobaculia bacterium]|nr:GerMN domain-containing protein [Thermoanaerobaculia bacterium]